MARVRITINQSGINGLVTNPVSPLYRHMVTVGATVSAVAKINVPVDSGRLRQSIDHELISRPPTLTARIVAPVDYAKFVHDGHGEIRPKRKKALKFKVRGKIVYATRTKPVAAQPFLTDAVKQVTGKTPHAATG